ncbi:hypothetical protein T12_2405 [Trichinella patagoniensis]|uniref:Uncharacterized protein n=1 Tax=Trichinella patagoniensis TaxID=990121 RepID=A0A0V0ZPJ4_9BILA|nr:hypothetical protein T12_2405 [Trichinella patagoniensis]
MKSLSPFPGFPIFLLATKCKLTWKILKADWSKWNRIIESSIFIGISWQVDYVRFPQVFHNYGSAIYEPVD